MLVVGWSDARWDSLAQLFIWVEWVRTMKSDVRHITHTCTQHV